MRRMLLFVASVGLGFGLVSLAVRAYPPIAVRAYFTGIDREAGGTHRIMHGPIPDASYRQIVKPSPDLLYSTFTYDLGEGPVRLRLPEHDGPWVAQVMDASGNSVGYLRRGDERAVIALDAHPIEGEDETVVRVSHERGAVLVRYLVERPAQVAELERKRRTIEVVRGR
jgi:uncharacterized membrane protein